MLVDQAEGLHEPLLSSDVCRRLKHYILLLRFDVQRKQHGRGFDVVVLGCPVQLVTLHFVLYIDGSPRIFV